MATEFLLPDIGEGLTEAQVVRWLVQVGESVGLDEPLVEVETAKAVVEIPAPRAGILLHHGGAPGDTIEVGSVLAVIGEPGEVWPPAGTAEGSAGDLPLVGTLSDDGEELPDRRVAPTPPGSSDVRALPIVRKLAREAGVDLSLVPGTGPEGRITRSDLEGYLAGKVGVAEMEPPAVPAPAGIGGDTGQAGAGDRRTPLTMLRRTIAEHMARSWAEIPHVTTFDEVDASRLLEARRALGRRHDRIIPIDALVAKAVVPVVQEFPEFNATLDGTELVLHGSVHLGIAVDTDDGLLVPVIRQAETADLLSLAATIADLGERGRRRTLKPDELRGATFTLSNIGALGGGYGTPIIPYGTTAILSVGRAVERPAVRQGEVVAAPLMPLSLSFDHRVIDGGLGRRFMARVVENLLEPALFLA